MVVPSADSLTSASTFARTAELYRDLHLLSKKINDAISLVDPQFFSALSQLSEVSKAKHSSLAIWATVDPLLMEGRELLFNWLSGRHRDSKDPPLAYAGLYTAGNFTSGGSLYIPGLKLCVHLLPGDFVLLWG